ncbi:acyltransferase [Limnobaculum zhutongyuii]|uniref:Acyltransferase n=1 Tax=Limnobaculum zhutongyuii TaxID=2498113 RepID=A0A411WPJ4_9GAMM|nr:acyltransferase family protein [Limnobaculum zhutongyuii]QBH97925.1 acyltransferase [Limnobaculum zhutongyuii]
MSGSLLAYLLMFNKDWTYKSIELIIFRSSKKHSNDMLLKHLLSIVGLSLIITSFFIINKSSVFPGWLATITVSGAFLMILAGPYAIFNKYILSNKLIVWVGLISYPLYLWHWPILSFARIVESELPSREIRIYAVIASFILSWLTYVLIEKPFRFGKYSGIKTIALLIIAIITGSIGYYTYINEGIANRKVIVDEKSANNLIVGPIWSYTSNDICLNTYHSDFPKDYGWWFCIQDKPTKPTILLLGNSYANHLYPGLIHNKHLKEQNILSIGTCGAEQVESYERMGEESRTPCTGTHHYRSQEFINDIIKDNPTIKYVIINGLRNVIYKDYIRRLKKKIDFLESKGITVIVFIPHIKLGYDIKGCFARPFKTPSKSCEMPISVQKAQLKAYSVMINQFKKTNPNVKFFDQNNLLCKDDTCEFKIDGMPVYRDNTDHFSEYASNKLAELFVEWANDNVPNILDK